MTDMEHYLPTDRIERCVANDVNELDVFSWNRFKMLKEKRACNDKAECPYCSSLNQGARSEIEFIY
jgi:hypothetical protein